MDVIQKCILGFCWVSCCGLLGWVLGLQHRIENLERRFLSTEEWCELNFREFRRDIYTSPKGRSDAREPETP